MRTQTVRTENELLVNLRFMKLDLDMEPGEQDMFIDGTLAEPEQSVQDMFLQRQLNSSGLIAGGHAAPERYGRAGGR